MGAALPIPTMPAVPVPAPSPTPALARIVPLSPPVTPTVPTSGAIISDRLARSGDILDKWKDSGRPLNTTEAPRPTGSGAAPR